MTMSETLLPELDREMAATRRPINFRGWMILASVLLAVVAACDRTSSPSVSRGPSRYLYVWAGTGHDSTRGLDMVTVLDANPASHTYGAVIAALTVDSGGLMPHHTELVLPAKGPFFANDFSGDKSFLIDFSNPEKPSSNGRIARVPGGRKIHSFVRLPSGNVLATFQFGDGERIRSRIARAFDGRHAIRCLTS